MKTKQKIDFQEKQMMLANETGLALAVVEGENSSVITVANNNSICEVLQKSEKFSPLCSSFCGEANNHVREVGEKVCLKCHAGLTYIAVPIDLSKDRSLSVITGRSFLKTEDYLEATMRAESGDWKEFDSSQLFDNILFSGSLKDIEDLAEKVENLSDDEKTELLFLEKDQTETDETIALNNLIEEFKNKDFANEENSFVENKISENAEEKSAWRSLFGSLLNLNYKQASISILQFLAKRYNFNSLAWLKPKGNRLEVNLASGKFKGTKMQISIALDDKRLLEAFNQETSLELLQKVEIKKENRKKIKLFPLVVGNNVRSALVIGDEIDAEQSKHISKFCRKLASQIEILQLREELEKQAMVSKILQKINDNLNEFDSDDFWNFVIGTAAELLQAERGSILIYNEENKEFKVKAIVGNQFDLQNEQVKIGEKVALKVLNKSKPFLVKDTQEVGIPPAPLDYKYKSNSFISYPILIGERKIGVLNFTDKIDSGTFDESDLQILDSIAPQITVAIDRALLKLRANEYEQLSMTDQLTGLPNLRYLEERLNEEIKRFQRYGNPTCFLMIDVDNFKSYNDNFGHTTGNKALQIVAQCLKSVLRGADIAARFGGEEFSILLPQTTIDEAAIIAERIREKVESAQFPNRQVTISIGIASFSNYVNSLQKLISSADKALYKAKDFGRNNVQLFVEDKK